MGFSAFHSIPDFESVMHSDAIAALNVLPDGV
jgi:hypothetical protein